jgi:large subunit ribosomal protein L17
MTARTVARVEAEGKEINDMTAKNIKKVTQFREDGEERLREMVEKVAKLEVVDRDRTGVEKRWGGKV